MADGAPPGGLQYESWEDLVRRSEIGIAPGTPLIRYVKALERIASEAAAAHKKKLLERACHLAWKCSHIYQTVQKEKGLPQDTRDRLKQSQIHLIKCMDIMEELKPKLKAMYEIKAAELAAAEAPEETNTPIEKLAFPEIPSNSKISKVAGGTSLSNGAQLRATFSEPSSPTDAGAPSKPPFANLATISSEGEPSDPPSQANLIDIDPSLVLGQTVPNNKTASDHNLADGNARLTTISPHTLYGWLQDEEEVYNVLLLDVRPTDHYRTSHVAPNLHKPAQCNIPPNELHQGVGAPELEDRLKRNFKKYFKRRASYSRVVILHLASEDVNLPTSPTQYLLTAMLEYGGSSQLQGRPMVVEGGYNNFYTYYQAFCSGKPKAVKQTVKTMGSLLREHNYPTVPSLAPEPAMPSRNVPVPPNGRQPSGDELGETPPSPTKARAPPVPSQPKPRTAPAQTPGVARPAAAPAVATPAPAPAPLVDLGAGANAGVQPEPPRSFAPPPSTTPLLLPGLAPTTAQAPPTPAPPSPAANPVLPPAASSSSSSLVDQAAAAAPPAGVLSSAQQSELQRQHRRGQYPNFPPPPYAAPAAAGGPRAAAPQPTGAQLPPRAQPAAAAATRETGERPRQPQAQPKPPARSLLDAPLPPQAAVRDAVGRTEPRPSQTPLTPQPPKAARAAPKPLGATSPAQQSPRRRDSAEHRHAAPSQPPPQAPKPAQAPQPKRPAGVGPAANGAVGRAVPPAQGLDGRSPAKKRAPPPVRPSAGKPSQAPGPTRSSAQEPVPSRAARPNVNRSLKPTPQRFPTRNTPRLREARMVSMEPIHGSSGRLLTGLKNLGNTCFMSAVLQCLANTTPLSTYFIQGRHRNEINHRNPLGSGGELVEEFGELILFMCCGQYRSISPRFFKQILGKHAPQFSGSGQHDCQEFAAFLMDGMHEDLNRVLKKEYREEPDYVGMPVAAAAKQSWGLHLRRNNSLMVDLFQGQFKSTIQCISCGYTSTTFSPFMFLTLPISSRNTNLRACLDAFSRRERVGGADQWRCSRCKQPREAIKTIEIWKLPAILIIHLKRFSFTGPFRDKITTLVDFPHQLDMRPHTAGPTRQRQFSLYGVCNHFGTLSGGHYIAYCKNVYNHRWFKYDDSTVSGMSSRDVCTSAGYLLFYTSVDFEDCTPSFD